MGEADEEGLVEPDGVGRGGSTGVAVSGSCSLRGVAIRAIDGVPSPSALMGVTRNSYTAIGSRPVISASGMSAGRMTAAATTGPAQGPRPASSTPATTPVQADTLREALAQAYNNNPTLLAARADQRAVDGRLPTRTHRQMSSVACAAADTT